MKKNSKSLWYVILAIVLAIVVGSWSGTEKEIWGIKLFSVYHIGGTLFLNALMLLVVPLVISSIIVGVAKMGNDASFKRLGIKIFGFYIGTNALAIIVGLLLANLFNPGIGSSGRPLLSDQPSLQMAQSPLMSDGSSSILQVLLQIIPPNLFDALAKGNMLGLILFSIIFGFCLSKVEAKAGNLLLTVAQGIFDIMIRITHLILYFLPLGVFFLVAKAFASTSSTFSSLGYFTLSVVIGLFLFMFVALPLLIKIVARVSPFPYFRAIGPALITAFSTSSSAATLPVTLDCVEKRAGISNRIASLVIPLGTSINMAGTALYACIAVLFVAQAYGVALSLSTQLLVALLSLITSIGIAGVPSGSLVAIIIILKMMGLPAEGIGLFIAVDRLLDMCRTTVNVFTDSTCALLVARTEGEETLLTR